MCNLPQSIYSVEGVREVDRAAIEDLGIPGYTMMTSAAMEALDEAFSRFPDTRRWQVICGAGNNGGDGYVLARLAAQQGIAVSVIALTPTDKLRGDAATAYADFVADGGIVGSWEGAPDPHADLIVDALLGSGLERDVGGLFAEVIEAINEHASPVLAIDIPSGLDGDSGSIRGTAVDADLTVTFVGLKTGLFLNDGPDCVGELRFSDLLIPHKCYDGASVQLRRIDYAQLSNVLPPRRRGAHKGDFGHLLLVGGGPGMPGAIRLAGEAALRCGAGRVSIATHPSHHAAISAGRPELMCHAVDSASDLGPLLQAVDTIAVGPGLGTGNWGGRLFDAVVKLDMPLVVDADALNRLAEAPVSRDQWILTPHPGEAGRLLGSGAGAVQGDRLGSTESLRDKYGGTIVLKGAGSLVSSVTGPAWICTSGNPGMASPGMGDVLTGVIASLLAQGMDYEQAAAYGVEVHARAGDAAAKAGQRGLIASDVLEELRSWVNPQT
ncbi:MAG: NAD(P)H-hydrate dehydratase [Gammaproteobacteria bacterium]